MPILGLHDLKALALSVFDDYWGLVALLYAPTERKLATF